jgi:hypothetical protein
VSFPRGALPRLEVVLLVEQDYDGTRRTRPATYQDLGKWIQAMASESVREMLRADGRFSVAENTEESPTRASGPTLAGGDYSSQAKGIAEMLVRDVLVKGPEQVKQVEDELLRAYFAGLIAAGKKV